MGYNFDQNLRMKKGELQYRLDKQKAGRCGSSAGRPRPYAKANMQLARLYSPQVVGQTITVTPKKDFERFRVGNYYSWYIIEEGLGTINGWEYTAKEIKDNFIIIPRKK